MALFTLLALSIACAPNNDSSAPTPTEKPGGTEIATSPTSKADNATPTPVQYLAKSDPELAALYTVKVEYWTEGSSVTFNATIIGGPSSNRLMHCQSQQWQWGDGINQVMQPGCPPYNEGDRFQRTWLIVHKYAEPGSYKVRFNYGKLYSDTIAIRID